MYLSSIITKRHFEHNPSWDIVYEWENEIKTSLSLNFFFEHIHLLNSRFVQKLGRKIPVVKRLVQVNKNAFAFEMSECRMHDFNNKRNIIPCIIDCYISNEFELNRFIKSFCKNKAVLVTNRQIFCLLQRHSLPFKVFHFPLSLPSKYKFCDIPLSDRQYDMAIVGRPNPVLLSFVEKYVKNHPEFVYVFHKREDGKQVYYSSKGEKIGALDTREKYFNLLKNSKMGIYSTSGMDNDKKSYDNCSIDTGVFHQVTPRFLELISCGCHVIARYEDNEDTEYYQMKLITESCNSYNDFETKVSYALSNPIDKEMFSQYLMMHYTSARINQLKLILNDI